MNRRDLIKFALLTSASASISRGLHAGVSTTSKASSAVFNDVQRKMVSVLAELIIPTTDTPGAIEAGVPNFIEVMVGDWYTNTERDLFMSGLAELDQRCNKIAGVAFIEAPQPQQVKALQEMEAIAAKYTSSNSALSALSSKGQDENTPFFSKMKELTVIGYYTSETGVLQELAYNPAPGRYDGDYDFSKVGRQWAY